MTQPRIDERPEQSGSPLNETLAQAPAEPGTPARKSSVKQILKILVSLALIAFLLHSTGIENTVARLSKANLWYIPVGVVLYLFAQYLSTYRWKFLGEALGFKRSMRELYDYYLIGMFSNQFLPGAIGGDAVRMVFLARATDRRKREALLTILAERGVGLAALLILTGLVCLTPVASPIPLHYRLVMLAMSAAGLIGFLVLRAAPLEAWVDRIPKLRLILQARIYWDKLPLLAKSIGMSLIVHCLMVAMHAMVAHALGIHVSFLYLALTYGMVALASVMPITQGGMGVREFAYQHLLSKVGVDPATGLAFGVYWLLITTLTSAVGGLVLIKGHYKTPSPQEMADGDVL